MNESYLVSVIIEAIDAITASGAVKSVSVALTVKFETTRITAVAAFLRRTVEESTGVLIASINTVILRFRHTSGVGRLFGIHRWILWEFFTLQCRISINRLCTINRRFHHGGIQWEKTSFLEIFKFEYWIY